MKILVTGAAGFVGQQVCKALVADGHDVVGSDLPSELHRVENCHWSKSGDVRDIVALRVAVDGCDAVVHLAGPVRGGAKKNPWISGVVQIAGTMNVAQVAQDAGVKKLLLASSFYVYDGMPPELAVTESTPLDLYRPEWFGQIKLISEYGCGQLFCGEQCWMRFGSAYGWSGSNVIADWLEVGLKGENLEVWGRGQRRNQYTYVDDVAAGVVIALDMTGPLNLIHPKQVSTGELAELLRREYSFDVSFDYDHGEGPSMPYMHSDLALNAGWSPRSLEQGIESMMRSRRQNGEVLDS